MRRGSLPWGTRIVAGAFTLSGVVHLVRPSVFEPLIPNVLGNPTPWVLGSGVAELICAAGLISRRRWAPVASTATLAVIWVGNWQMAIDVTSANESAAATAAVWARLPLQIPLMLWAWRSPVRARDDMDSAEPGRV
jgi:uncharacterized membrane protein